MIRGKIIDRYNDDITLNIDNILKKITVYDIYHFYTPFPFKLGHDYKSPLRIDRNPSFSVKQSKLTGQVYHIDYARAEHPYSGNCFQYVSGLYRCDFNEALEHINTDFQLGLGGQLLLPNAKYLEITKGYDQPEKIVQYKHIDVFTRKMNQSEIDFWNRRYINSDELNRNYIFGFDRLFLDGQRITNPKHMLRFAYYFPKLDRWKIYTPYADKKKKEYKWVSNLSLDVVECITSIRPDKICLGTKSRKDRILLQKFVPETFSTQNESEAGISPDNIEFIKDNSQRCILFYDNDEQGVKSCKFYNQFGLGYVNLPKGLDAKDPDEMVVKYGLNALENFLKNKKII